MKHTLLRGDFMNDLMFEKLIQAIESTDWLSLLIQVIGILVPIIWAYWISKKETLKTKKEFEIQNRVLDERQERLEKIQESIDRNICTLSNQHISLSNTQIAVEENLRELKNLAELSRESNLLEMQKIYPEFFKRYKEFEVDFKELEYYKDKYLKEFKDDLQFVNLRELRDSVRKIESTDMLFLGKEQVPMLVYSDFIKLKEVLWDNACAKEVKYEDYFKGTFYKLQKTVHSFQKKLYQ